MDYTSLIVGNLCTLLAMIANSFSSTRKTTKGILWAQNVSQIVYFISALFLRGYSAAVQNVVGFLRNLAAIRQIRNKTLEWLLIGLGAVLGIAFNNRGPVGLLPVIGNLQYTLVIFRFSDRERVVKISFMISLFFFVIFNFTLYNFVGVLSDLAVIVTTAIVLLKKPKS